MAQRVATGPARRRHGLPLVQAKGLQTNVQRQGNRW
jgi:hypothetical protein